MLQSSYTSITREQFSLLRQAKKLIKDEFDEELMLQDAKVLDSIYEYALRSEKEQLFDIFSSLTNGEEPTAVVSTHEAKPTHTTKPVNDAGKVKIGDTVNGQKCVAMYRGKPVFE